MLAANPISIHLSNNPWPWVFWILVSLAFCAAIALAAILANHHDDAKAGVTHHRSRWEDQT